MCQISACEPTVFHGLLGLGFAALLRFLLLVDEAGELLAQGELLAVGLLDEGVLQQVGHGRPRLKVLYQAPAHRGWGEGETTHTRSPHIHTPSQRQLTHCRCRNLLLVDLAPGDDVISIQLIFSSGL